MTHDSSRSSARARDLLDCGIRGLQKIQQSLGPGFDTAMQAMIERRQQGGKFLVTGLGKSWHISRKIAATMASTGTVAYALHPSEALHGDLGLVQPGDVMLALSYSGESEELMRLLPFARRAGALVVSITCSTTNSVARMSDHVIPVVIDQEACPFNLAPTTSTLVTLAVGDAIAILLEEAAGFTREDYARLHPAGAIGRALRLFVRDVMRPLERTASVPDSANIHDAVLAMTKHKSGAVGIVDAQGVLKGILTDGDLRRLLSQNVDMAATLVAKVMTANPVTIRDDRLAADAMAIFEQRAIDDLLVVDEAGRLRGLVDLQDLPRMKLL